MPKNVINLGLDVDGVLLDYISGFFSYLPSVGIYPACKPDEVDNFDFRCAFPGKERPEIKKLITDFSVTEGFGRLPAYNGAVEAVNRIKSHFGDQLRIIAITSAGTSDETLRLRKQNLELFPFDEVNVLPLAGDKTEQLAKLGAYSLFVDDLLSNVNAAQSVGVRGVLFRQLYNAMDYHDLAIDSWNEEGFNTVFNALLEISNNINLRIAS